jgi:hypothetical protein
MNLTNHQKRIGALVAALGGPEAVKKINPTGEIQCSENSIRVDFPPEGDTQKRVKLTYQPNGEITVRLIEIREVEALPDVAQSSVRTVLKNVCGIEL